MNKLLVDTHRRKNIEFLKARDYYFDSARKLNNTKRKLVILPTVILLISYLVFTWLNYFNFYWEIQSINIFIKLYDNYIDLFLGILSIVTFIIVFIIDDKILHKKTISNMLREEYDNRIFKLERNIFAYDYSNIDKFLTKAKKVPDYYKYEVWYGEIFCDDIGRNTLCSQMDNIIYTYYIYRDSLKYYWKKMGIIVVSILLLILITHNTIHPIIVLIAALELIKITFDEIKTSKDLIGLNERLKNIIMEKDLYQEIIDKLPYHIRCLQDCIIKNRDNGLFVPKKIRDIHLDEDSEFYVELNEVKERFLDENTTGMPESEEELEVLSMDESKTFTLKNLHDRLLLMLDDIHSAFVESNVSYTLDGGTLIGAVRRNVSGINADKNNSIDVENGKFLFWDDDIDIAISIDELKKAKKIICAKLGHKYVIQDYDNEKFYSPRLSNFRIRERNEKSFVSEKDSELWEKYTRNGIFIDVYAYSPILINQTFDKIYRHLFIHPIHKKIMGIEKKWKYKDNSIKYEKKFLKYKKRYLKFVNFYIKHARNDSFFSYVPNFINNFKKAGPYIPKDVLFGQKRMANFEGEKRPIPYNPEKVLKSMYGEEWYISPFSSREDLIEKYDGRWYSYAKSKVSVMKHIKNLNLK